MIASVLIDIKRVWFKIALNQNNLYFTTSKAIDLIKYKILIVRMEVYEVRDKVLNVWNICDTWVTLNKDRLINM